MLSKGSSCNYLQTNADIIKINSTLIWNNSRHGEHWAKYRGNITCCVSYDALIAIRFPTSFFHVFNVHGSVHRESMSI